MALERQTVSLNIATSINQKADDKQIDATQLAASKNVRIKKDKRVQKREGLQDYNTTQESLTGTNPLLIGSSASQSWVREYKDQVIMQNKGALYVRNLTANNWKQTGYTQQIRMTSETVAAGSYIAEDCDGIRAGDLDIFMFKEYDKIRLSVRRISDGIWLYKDQIIYTKSGSNFMGYLRVIEMASVVAVMWIDTSIKGLTINKTTYALSSVITIVSAATTGCTSLDAVYIANSAAGEVIALGYRTATGSVRLRTINSSLASTGPGEYTTGEVGQQRVSVYVDSAQPNDVFFVCENVIAAVSALGQRQTSGGFNVRWGAATIGAGSWTLKNATQTIADFTYEPTVKNSPYYFANAYTQITDASNSSNILILMSVINVFTDISETWSFIGSKAGAVVNAASLYSHGISICGKVTTDIERTTNVFPAVIQRESDQIIAVFDYWRGQEVRKCSIAAVLDGGDIAFTRSTLTTLPQTQVSSAGFWFYTNRYTRGIANDDSVERGIALVSGVFATNRSESIEVNNTLIWGAGVARSYDGITVGELGFLVPPKKIYMSTGVGVSLTVTTVGAGATRQVRSITLPCGAHIQASANVLNQQFYISLDDTGAAWQFYFVIDGVGAPPTGAGTNIPVYIRAVDTPGEVAQKLEDVLFTTGSGYNFLRDATRTNNDYSSTIYIRNFTAGAVGTPDAVNDFANLTGTPLIEDGTYLVRAVQVYVDRFGNTYRSAPSPQSTIVVSADTALYSFCVLAPPITSRPFAQNYIEIYLSTANGSILYKISRNNNGFDALTWSGASGQYYARRRLLNELALEAEYGVTLVGYSNNQQLYTTGGIFENDYPQNWQFLFRFKDSVGVGGFSVNPKLVVFSKQIFTGEGISFSDFLSIDIDTDDEALTGAESLDDKLVLFKREAKYVVVGDVPNDAGGGGSLSVPQLVASDTGCNDFRSIVKNTDGLYYRSAKGIYRLGRDLQDKYIGDRVEDTNGFTISSAQLFKSTNEIVYFFSNSQEALCYNYYFDVWTVWRNHTCVNAYAGTKLYIIRADGRVLYSTPTVIKDVENGVTTAVPYTIEMPWLKVKGQQDYQRIKELMLLGEYKTAHSMIAEIWWDYDQRDAVKQTLTIASSSVISGTDYADQTYQIRFAPQKQKCEAIKVRFTDVPDTSTSGESCTLNAVDFSVGLKSGLSKLKTGKQV